MAQILFKNCNLLDNKNQTLQPGYWVLINDNLIQEVSQKEIASEGATIIDLKNKTLMPGLIDAHVHVTATDLDLANDYIPDSEITVQAARFMEDMLMRGFTSIRDAGGADIGLSNAVKKGLIKGPRLFYSGKAISQTGGHGDFRKATSKESIFDCTCAGSTISVLADGVDAVRKAVREEVRKGATQIKIMASGGVASPTDKITNLQYSEEEIKAIVEEAHNAGIYVMAHAYTPAAIIRCVKLGVRTIEHGNLLNEEAAEVMADHGAFLVPTLVVYEALAALGPELHYPPASLAKISHVKDDGIHAIKIARDKGVKIGLGTDLLGVQGQTWQSQEFILRSSIERPYDTIYSATAINAEILHQIGKLGCIQAGAYADLLVVNGDPLTDISLLAGQGQALDLIMKDGVIYKNNL